jgi:phosphatidylinositol 4-kinase
MSEDFGFILDLYVGGVNFESSPFKLTSEMIQVLGGPSSPSYAHFTDLVVKGFLAARPFAEEIVGMVGLMGESGLPCFKGDGEGTARKLRERFGGGKSEREAGVLIREKIRVSHENGRRYGKVEFNV